MSRARFIRRLIVVIIMGVISSATVMAQEPTGDEPFDGSGVLDSLFDDSEDVETDDKAEPEHIDHLSQFIATGGIRLRGYFEAKGGAGVGWTVWPDVSDLLKGYDGTIGLEAAASISFDARPDPAFGFYGSFSSGLDPFAGAYFSNLNVGSVYIDYAPFEPLYIRAGRFATTWGQGRLFSGITNLMSDAAGLFSFRVSVPTWLDGVTAFGLMGTSFYPQGATPTYRHAGLAGKLDKVLFDTMVSVAARYQVYEGLNVLLSLKKVILGVDTLCDIVVHNGSEGTYPRVLAGFFKEWEDVLVYGEYYFNGQNSLWNDHTLGLAVGFNNIFSTQIDLGFQWGHAFIDGSGSIVSGISWTPWKYITASLALPIAYGPDGSRYVSTGNDDPAKRRLALVFLFKMKVSF